MTAIKIEAIKGVAGPSLYVNDTRVSGPKPWGGGSLMAAFHVDAADMLREIRSVIGNDAFAAAVRTATGES